VAAAVDWGVAEKVAIRTAKKDPFAASYHYQSLQPDFDRLTAVAEELVAQETGLRSLAGPARARVTDRPGWIRANLASFQGAENRVQNPYLLYPPVPVTT
jgi:uncharacterized protein (DUF2342 family)